MPMSRRKFNFLLVASPLALTASPSILANASTTPQFQTALSIPALNLPPKVLALEAEVHAMNGKFSWYHHNELRHEYMGIDERTSRVHADVILAHSVMDHYIMNTQGDWHIHDGNPLAGIETLINRAKQNADLVHLRAACLILAGDTYQQVGQSATATYLYQSVVNHSRLFGLPKSFEPYRALAQSRLVTPLI